MATVQQCSATCHAQVLRAPSSVTGSSARLAKPFLGPQLQHRAVQAAAHSRRAASGAVRAETQYLSSAQKAKELVEQEGYKVVDVRDEKQWEKAHIKGATHLPYYTVNNDNDIQTVLLRQAHNNFAGMLYGLAFTKPNPVFLSSAKTLFPDKGAKLLLVCQEGLRANSAADDLEDAGYTNLAVLEKGLNKVPSKLFDSEGERELKEAGKGGFIAIQTQFSIVLGSILVSLLLFTQFFPDAALKILGAQ